MVLRVEFSGSNKTLSDPLATGMYINVDDPKNSNPRLPNVIVTSKQKKGVNQL